MEKVRPVSILYITLALVRLSLMLLVKRKLWHFFRGFLRKRSAQMCPAKPENHIFSLAYFLYNARIRQSVL